MTSFTVYGEPQGKARPRFAKGRAYTPKATVEYERKIRQAFKEANGVYSDRDAFIIKLFSYYPIPKSTSKKTKAEMLLHRLFPSKRPDIDNIEKVVEDALNNVAYKDDCMIICAIKAKFYSVLPRIDVSISPIKFDDPAFLFIKEQARSFAGVYVSEHIDEIKEKTK